MEQKLKLPKGRKLSETPLHVHSTFMDFATAVEADVLYPIAFRDRAALDRWAAEQNLHPYKIGTFKKDRSAVSYRGTLRIWPDGELSYSQVWVRAKFRNYRKSILRHLIECNDLDGAVDIYDADHAVSKKRLTSVWPEAWVNLALVSRSMNRSIGAMLEKDPLGVENGTSVINANLEFMFKLLCKPGAMMRRENLQVYFDEASERFLGKISSPEDILAVSNANGFLTEIAMKNGLENRRPNFVIIAAPEK